MDNVIPFPINDKSALQGILATAGQLYAKAGLSEKAIEDAVAELKPLIEQFMPGRQEFVMELPAEWGLTEEQAKSVGTAHDKCVNEIFAYFTMQVGMALSTIVGIVGSKHTT